MHSSVNTILTNNKTDGIFYSHVSMMDPYGTFTLNRHILENFWECYCTDIDNGEYKYGIAEVSNQHMPVLVDVDLKIEEEKNPFESSKLYTIEQVEKIISIYHTVLKEIVDECDDTNLMCVLLEKNPYRATSGENMLIKNGFHLHFPNIFMDKKDQKMHLIPRVKKLVDDAKIFATLGKERSGDVIDEGYLNVRWLMYGSKKSEQMEPYIITKIYNSSMKELTLNAAFMYYNVFDKNEKVIQIRDNIKYYLPRILSIVPANRISLIKDVKSGIVPSFDQIKKNAKDQTKPQRIYEKTSQEENIKIASQLIPLLSVDRATDYTEWMTVGWALFNISDGSNDGYNLWLDFSRKCPEKFDETRCAYDWGKMQKSDMTIATLKYYASIDNPDEYKRLKRDQTNKIIDDSLSGTHNDIAKILFAEYGNEFVCAKISPETWYRFNGHIWDEIEGGIDLRRKISDEIPLLIREKCRDLFNTEGDPDDAKLKQYQKLIKDLKSAPFKNNVMKEACEIFYNNRFLDKLDSNPYLIAFKNGVSDLEKHTFRAGKPEDFISKSLPINLKDYAETDDEITETYSFLEKVFPDKSLRDFFLDSNSEIFVGKNLRKEVQMWTGDKGNNGKSVMQRLFSKMLGQKFCIKMETTLITGNKPNSGGAWPELRRAGNGVRAVFFDEMTDEEEIKLSMFKKLSGNDTFPARDCFEKGKDMKDYEPMFKMFIISNKLAKFHKGGDQATWNRVCVIPFETVFCGQEDPAPDTYEEQFRQKRFPMDKNMDTKISKLVEPLAWILTQRFAKPKVMFKPEKVLQAIIAYQRRNDIYRQFIEECIIQDDTAKITLIEVYTAIKEWIKESLPQQKMPEKGEVKDYFITRWGDESKGIKWTGYRTRTLQDDIEVGDVIILEPKDMVKKNKPPM